MTPEGKGVEPGQLQSAGQFKNVSQLQVALKSQVPLGQQGYCAQQFRTTILGNNHHKIIIANNPLVLNKKQ